MNDPSSEAGIVDYYDTVEIDYRLAWHLDSQLAMHYGLWDRGVRTLRAALQRENAILAELAHIKSTDRVLDAGCGVGGSSIFLAEHIGCRVTGISLSAHQIQRAEAAAAAAARNISQLAQYKVADFTATELSDASFDVVWAIESACHAADKSGFLREAFRLLKPGGRLIVADGFVRSGKLTPKEQWVMRQWLDGWSVPDLATLDGFGHMAKKSGFIDTRTMDYTQLVIPSSRRLYALSLAGIPVDWLSRKLGLRSQRTQGNFIAARYQYIALRQGLWQYGVVCAHKQS